MLWRFDTMLFVCWPDDALKTAMELGGRLSRSADVLPTLGLELADEVSNALGLVLFRIILFFIVSHEYTHIVHGRSLPQADDSMFLSKIMADGRNGSLETQPLEVTADSYAIYHIMGNRSNRRCLPKLLLEKT